MSGKLEDLFLRYSTAEEDESELADALKAEIERLIEVIGQWSRKLGGLPQQRHPGHLLRVCDEAISQALLASHSNDYETTLASLQRAAHALADIQMAWQANLAYEAAEKAHAALQSLFPSTSLRPLLTVHDLALLMDASSSLLQRGKYRQGELLGRACQRRSETLCERQAATATTLRGRLDLLSALCDEVSGLLPHGHADWTERSALRHVEVLLQEQRYALAERLLDDLEVELIPHRTFLAFYRGFLAANTLPALSPSIADINLRELINAQSWSAASSYLIGSSLEELSETLAEAPARADLIQQQMAAYHQ
jgi:hypothetical protein